MLGVVWETQTPIWAGADRDSWLCSLLSYRPSISTMFRYLVFRTVRYISIQTLEHGPVLKVRLEPATSRMPHLIAESLAVDENP